MCLGSRGSINSEGGGAGVLRERASSPAPPPPLPQMFIRGGGSGWVP